MKNKVFSKLLYALLAAIFLSSLYCTSQHAGGSEIGNPFIVVGTVTDSTGKGLKNISMYLVDLAQMNPEKLCEDSLYHTMSGFDGHYCFPGIFSGNYNLIGIDSTGNRMFLRKVDICRDGVASENDTVNSGVDTVKNAATVVVLINNCNNRDTAVIFVPGTVFKVSADSCGEYLLRCPSTRIDVAVYRKDTLYMIGEHIEVLPGQWIDLTGKTYDVPTPEIISGLISGLVGQMYFFNAGGNTPGPSHPVEYRFDWGDSFSDWNQSSQRGHVWDMPGSFLVRVQSRSVRDTVFLSEWSEGLLVSIVESGGN